MGKIEMEIKFERGQMKIQPACVCYPACILYLWDTPPHFWIIHLNAPGYALWCPGPRWIFQTRVTST